MNLDNALACISPVDEAAKKRASLHWLDVAKPLFSLGKLEDLVSQIAAITGNEHFSLDKRALVVMCADNGVVCEGVTQTGHSVTATVAKNFTLGKTSACIMASYAGVDVFPVDIGMATDVENVTNTDIKVAYGTKNIAKEPAMTRDMAIKAIELGINKALELKSSGYNILLTGEMGIGNTTTSSACAAVLLNKPVESVTGRGAGLSSEGLSKKISVIKKAIETNKPDRSDSLDVLAKLGGLDIAGLAGVFIGGAVVKLPVVADGFISSVAALIAVRLCNTAREYIIPSHRSNEPACNAILAELGLSPIIDADMHLGEGTGAVALMPLLDMAYGVYNRLHTFQSWDGGEVYKVLK